MAGCLTTKGNFLAFSVIITTLIVLVTCSHHELHIPNSYGTKLPYEESISDGEWKLINAKWTGSPGQCWFRHVSSVIRHGARNPGNDDIENVDKIVDMINKVNKNNNKWRNPFTSDQEKSLTELGRKEQLQLGKRFGGKFYPLFQSKDGVNNNASKDNFIFTSSHKERTKESMQMFKQGLFQSTNIDFTDVETKISDNKLRFHKLCHKYRESLKNTSIHQEFNSFLQNKSMVTLVNKIAVKLGLQEDALNADDILSIWVIGVLQKSLDGESEWLELFNEKDLDVLQYANDLKNYWRKSYGDKIQKDMSYPLLKDILHYLRKAKRASTRGESSYPRAVFRSAHSETLLSLYGALDLFKDPYPLKSVTYYDLPYVEHRHFRTSRMVPFSANLALVLYRCKTSIKPLPEGSRLPLQIEWPWMFHDYMVQLFLNEVPVKIPSCPYDLCSYDEFVNYISGLLQNNESFDKICKLDKTNEEMETNNEKSDQSKDEL